LRRLLGLIVCCFAIATAYLAYVIAERQLMLEKFSRYNDSWSIAQTVSEYMRLEERLGDLALGEPGVSRDEVRMRLDFMLSRMEILQHGSLKAFMLKSPDRRALLEKLGAVLERLDRGLAGMDAEGMKSTLVSMGELDAPLTALASTSMARDVAIIDKAEAHVSRLHIVYTAVAAGLVLCGIVLIIMLIRHNRLLDRAYGRMRRLTDDLRRASEELQTQNSRLEHDAHHDALTGLANRVLFRQNLGGRLQRAMTGGPVAVILLLDLDGFKDVNDTLGHDVGDALLQAVAGRLEYIAGPGDMVCRLGGDEFALLSAGMTEEEALALAERIMKEIGRSYRINMLGIEIGTCVGIATSRGEPDPDELFKHADLALYEAKAAGPGHARIFRHEMLERLREKKSLEADLQKALENGEMEVHYQPLARTATRAVCGYEALLRWTHPQRGPVPPMEFIPVAEKIGMIFPLGEWVLKEACREAARWNEPLRIAVNLSPVQFRSRELLQSVRAALSESGLDPARLELEITESVMLEKNEQTLETLRGLKALGIAMAMDDFGTGYSSLGSLSRFPFDKIKVDSSFVRDLTVRNDAMAIAELVIGVGRSLRMTTTAEGVETEEQYACLKKLGCDEVQGYLIGKPEPVEALAHLHGDRGAGEAPAGGKPAARKGRRRG